MNEDAAFIKRSLLLEIKDLEEKINIEKGLHRNYERNLYTEKQETYTDEGLSWKNLIISFLLGILVMKALLII